MKKFYKGIANKIDSKLILILVIFYTLFNVVFVVKIAYLRAFLMEKPIRSSWSDVFMSILIDWTVVIIFMTLMAISTKSLIKKNVSWKIIITLHFFLSIFIGIAILVFGGLFDILVGRSTVADLDLGDVLTKFVYVLDLNFLIYAAMICIVYAYYYLQQVKESEKKRSRLQSQLVDTRMRMLTSQLKPHFLFNTLNCISTLTKTNYKDAQDTIADLSEFLRRILYGNDANLITLAEELKTLNYYLNILHVRFSEHLVIEKDIDASLLKEKLPALLLQPIIENSVKYGYSYENPTLKITLLLKRIGDAMEIIIENNGKPLKGELTDLTASGIGLSNTQERLKNLYGDRYTFDVRNKASGKGVETIIKIPIQ